MTFIYASGFFYLRECLAGDFIFCDDQHKTLCDTFLSRIIERNRSPSQNYLLKNRTK
ncbi:hypothetical protein CIT292_10779 [Citrobacter youngae ATCC 29220]|uniref:Uncharacterized protein n=1 Tax=Citrobacter youngae ATCC 29220 TaxID=500640 RepID=D4BJD6_9ENTR|nr:hypothetical protein CIT292_10779 [Citrobacter youngae ATCC 29220]